MKADLGSPGHRAHLAPRATCSLRAVRAEARARSWLGELCACATLPPRPHSLPRASSARGRKRVQCGSRQASRGHEPTVPAEGPELAAPCAWTPGGPSGQPRWWKKLPSGPDPEPHAASRVLACYLLWAMEAGRSGTKYGRGDLKGVFVGALALPTPIRILPSIPERTAFVWLLPCYLIYLWHTATAFQEGLLRGGAPSSWKQAAKGVQVRATVPELVCLAWRVCCCGAIW